MDSDPPAKMKASALSYQLISPYLKSDIWECELSPNDAERICNDQFWKDVLVSWAKYKGKCKENETSHFIWFNSSIKANKRMLFIERAYKAGLKWVHQLYQGNIPIGPEEASSKFKLSVMEYNTLISAIPKQWKNSARMGLTVYQRSLPQKNLSQVVYKELVKCPSGLQEKIGQWEKALGSCPPDEFYSCFNSIYKCTNVSKLRSFQFRILHRAITLNAQLYRWGMAQTNLCTWCQEHKETMEHFFVSCVVVQDLWAKIAEHVKKEFNVVIEASAKNILWNNVHKSKLHPVNLIVLKVKQYIYRQRCASKILRFNEILNEIRNFKSIQKYVAIKNGHLPKHYKKWGDDDLEVMQEPEDTVKQLLSQLP